MKKFYPMMVDIAGKNVLVVGGGYVASRKIKSLIEYGAIIKVVAPTLCEELKCLKKEYDFNWIARNYAPHELDGMFMVFGATDDLGVNRKVSTDAKDKGVLASILDDTEISNFIIPSKVRAGDLTITVSTNGKSPMLAKKIKEELAQQYDEKYAGFLNILGEIRQLSLGTITERAIREKMFEDIVYSSLFEDYKLGKMPDLKQKVYDIFEKYKDCNL